MFSLKLTFFKIKLYQFDSPYPHKFKKNFRHFGKKSIVLEYVLGLYLFFVLKGQT